MGTTYSVKFFQRFPWLKSDLKPLIESRLSELVLTFQHEKDSLVSQFNSIEVNRSFSVNEDFSYLLTLSDQLYSRSKGLFDPTIGPLLSVWGFGSNANHSNVPTAMDIELARAKVGFPQLVYESGSVLKTVPGLELDFSSIAKGYAVDEIVRLLTTKGVLASYVEIGGDLRATGTKPNGEPWRIGINRPDETAAIDDVLLVLPLQNYALATSGTYRQSNLVKDQERSHIINPISGESYYGSIVSVTVLAPTCVMADGVATFLLLMTVEDALKFVETDKDLEVLIIERYENQFKTHFHLLFPKTRS